MSNDQVVFKVTPLTVMQQLNLHIQSDRGSDHSNKHVDCEIKCETLNVFTEILIKQYSRVFLRVT